jgi:activator of Hsp90 ATPase-like protein
MNEKDAILTDTPLALTELPVAKTAMLIRRPVSEVFAAFVDPDVTSKFWFTRGSGTLEPGVTVTWHWDMYGFSTQARTIEIVPDRRVLDPHRVALLPPPGRHHLRQHHQFRLYRQRRRGHEARRRVDRGFHLRPRRSQGVAGARHRAESRRRSLPRRPRESARCGTCMTSFLGTCRFSRVSND